MNAEIEISLTKNSQIDPLSPRKELNLMPDKKPKGKFGVLTLAGSVLGLAGSIVFGNFIISAVAVGVGISYAVYCLSRSKSQVRRRGVDQLNDVLEVFYGFDPYGDEDGYYGFDRTKLLELTDENDKKLDRKISQSTFVQQKAILEMKKANGNIDHVVATYFNRELQNVDVVESYKSDSYLWQKNFESIAKKSGLELTKSWFS